MPLDSIEDERFFAAIGRLAVTWAQLEAGIDSMVLIVHRTGLSKEPELPRALQRKIDYLREAFKGIGITEDALAGYLSLLDAIETESETRHDIIHGFAVQHIEGEGRAKLIRRIRNKTGWTEKTVHVSTETISNAAFSAMKLCTKLIDIVSKFYEWPQAREPRPDERTE